MRLPDDMLTVQGHHISSIIDVSRFAMERGRELETYIERLNDAIRNSKFRVHYRLTVQHVAPAALTADLSLIHFVSCNLENTDFTGSTISGPISLDHCILDASLPPITVEPNELFRYPPSKAARELGVTDPKDIMVLRWGLTQDARHVGQAFLWLERRYPKTEVVLARLLKGLPARPPRRMNWVP
ncbi:hypothetical protein TPY_2272 [Sulfobacillus acidophilus TPY]|nr:hypothetical protein TPY_2272 [Sulfobacillus acidophilus TPY]